jgi:hypothetical protein
MTLPRIQYGAVLETTVPAIGFRAGSGATTRVVSLLAEPLSEHLDWIEAVDLVARTGPHPPLDIEIPGPAVGLKGACVAVCSQVRLIPRARIRPGMLGTVPEPYLERIRESVRLLMAL